MKLFKKLSALLIAMIMVIGMVVPALAATTPVETPTGGFTITLTDVENDERATHIYEAYQIFKGDLAKDDKGTTTDTSDDVLVLSNIDWGTGIKEDQRGAFAAALASAFASKTDAKYAAIKALTANSTAREVAEAIGAIQAVADSEDAQAIAAVIGATTGDAGNKVYTYLSTTKVTGDTSISVSEPGYYFVADQLNYLDTVQQTAYTRYILQVVSNVNVTTKTVVPTSEKKVKDTNDSKEATTAANASDYETNDNLQKEQDTADYDIGDDVPYVLRAKIPTSELKYYDEYQLAFIDDMSAGLSLNTSSAKVTVYAATIDGNGVISKVGDNIYTDVAITGSDVTGTGDGKIASTVSPAGHVYKFDLGNVLASTGTFIINKNGYTGADYVIYELSYTAKLTGDAVVIGNPGNPNKSYIEYSNNPNVPTSKGRTPDDINVVFTYKVDVDKVDPDFRPLEGAGFTLLKKYVSLPTGTTATTITSDTTFAAGSWYSESVTTGEGSNASTSTTIWKAVEVIDAAAGKTAFEFKGIDDGEYRIIESTTPTGYNTMEPINFTVTATHAQDPSTTLELTNLDVDNTAFKTATAAGNIEFTRAGVTGENATKTVAATSGEIYTEIINMNGTQLPSTGGIGTTIFYVVGALLVVGAGVILVTRRRMQNQE